MLFKNQNYSILLENDAVFVLFVSEINAIIYSKITQDALCIEISRSARKEAYSAYKTLQVLPVILYHD